MFGEVWKWAGSFRQTEKNIRVDWIKISINLKLLLDDTQWWIKNKTYAEDEIAIRFKHRLVSIHCFPNGNGRHSRMMADLISEKNFNAEVFSWGNSNLTEANKVRENYIDALRDADKGDIQPLIKFARS
jgi:Fic-DOC domain mobile mystery protein B